jgi:hypothetical protein
VPGECLTITHSICAGPLDGFQFLEGLLSVARPKIQVAGHLEGPPAWQQQAVSRSHDQSLFHSVNEQPRLAHGGGEQLDASVRSKPEGPFATYSEVTRRVASNLQHREYV